MYISQRRVVNNVNITPHALQSDTCLDFCQTDIDNHADSHVFGKNFLPLTFTNEVCTVSGFLGTPQATDIPIYNAATAYTNENGETLILIFGRGLWFGDKMDKSLINPNQMRAYGIKICDDPIDEHRELGIVAKDESGKEEFIPLMMIGSTCTFDTRCPTEDEMQHCRHIFLSDQDSWDPSTEIFNISMLEKEYEYNKFRYVADVSNMLPPTVEFNDDNFIRDSDKCISSLGVVYTHGLSSALRDKVNVSTQEIGAVFTNQRHSGINANDLSEKWHIGLEKARQTLKTTTQDHVRSAVGEIQQRYRTNGLTSNNNRLRGIKLYTDTFLFSKSSLLNNTCAQIYTDGNGFIVTYPVKKKKDIADTLTRFINEYGIPDAIHSDGAKEEVSANSSFRKVARRYNIKMTSNEAYSSNQNRAENYVKIIQARMRRRAQLRGIPTRLWDYQVEWEAQIYSRTAGTDGKTGIERLTGETPDISDWLDFEFYDLVIYLKSKNENALARWIGVAEDIGNKLTYKILLENGQVIVRSSVQHLTKDQVNNPIMQERIKNYQLNMLNAINESNIKPIENIEKFIWEEDLDLPNQNKFGTEYEFKKEIAEADDLQEKLNNYPNKGVGRYTGVEVCLPTASGERRMGIIRDKLKEANNSAIDDYKPYADHSLYKVDFSDGASREVTANIIAENMLSQVDSEGTHFQLLKEICDHQSNGHAISRRDGCKVRSNGKVVPKKTTAGWKLQVEWKDGSMNWIDLKDLKQSFPIEVAEYAIANHIDDEPAFKWWVRDALRQRDRMIAKVERSSTTKSKGKPTKKYWRETHKFGIEIPKTVEQALAIDRKTGTTHWQEAINKEMTNVKIAFEEVEGVTPEQMRKGQTKPGYKYCGTHMIFDIKMDGKFTRKARLVADGHRTAPPSSMTYSSVVSRDSVRIAFLLASLNDLDILACDVGNAYLNASCREKLWTIAGKEFGSDEGKVMIISRALYGLKSSGAAWRAMLAETLKKMGYKSSEADPDVWMKRATKANGREYYKYMLVYVDDILHLAENPKDDMDVLGRDYKLKEGSVGRPERYLGANIERVQLNCGGEYWAMHCSDYLEGAIKSANSLLKKDNQVNNNPLKLFGQGRRPYDINYKPELDITSELSAAGINIFQQLIGSLRWAIELGRIDIYTEVSYLSKFLCNPREGHLDAAFQVFRYLQVSLKNKKQGRIVFDSSFVEAPENMFLQNKEYLESWKDFYPDANEVASKNTPKPLGESVSMRVYVDANHAGDMVTRRSHSGVLIYVNNALIMWHSKRQNTVETSTFGSEFIAMRIATEMTEALRYKLRSFGVSIDGPTEVFCDNESVVKNSSIPQSTLNKKHNAVCYHRVREAQAAGIIKVGWIPSNENLADLLTKTTMGNHVKDNITEKLFFDDAKPKGNSRS